MRSKHEKWLKTGEIRRFKTFHHARIILPWQIKRILESIPSSLHQAERRDKHEQQHGEHRAHGQRGGDVLAVLLQVGEERDDERRRQCVLQHEREHQRLFIRDEGKEHERHETEDHCHDGQAQAQRDCDGLHQALADLELIAHDQQDQRGGRRGDEGDHLHEHCAESSRRDGPVYAQRAEHDAQRHADEGLVGQHVGKHGPGRHPAALGALERGEKHGVSEHRLSNIDHRIGGRLILTGEERKERVAEHAALEGGHQQRHVAVVGFDEPLERIAGQQRQQAAAKHQREHEQQLAAVLCGKERLEEHGRQQNVADDRLEAGVALVVEDAARGAQTAQQDHRQHWQHHGKNLGKHSVLLDFSC